MQAHFEDRKQIVDLVVSKYTFMIEYKNNF